MSRGELPPLPWGAVQIQGFLPHRYPFLLIDRILAVEPDRRLVALKNISVSDPVLVGHFPGEPIYPGVLLVEALAQAAGVLGYFSPPQGHKTNILTSIEKARFRRKVVPGDTLTLEIDVDRKPRPPFHWFNGRATVDGDIAAEVTVSAFFKPLGDQ